MKTSELIMIALALLFFASCEKEKTYATKENAEVEINIKSPESNGNATVGQEVSVEGIIAANGWMGGWKLTITSSNADTLVLYEDHYNQTQYNFHYHWFPEASDTGTVHINIDALDVDFNSLKSESITIHCQ